MRLTKAQWALLGHLLALTTCMWLAMSGLLGEAAQPVQQQIDTRTHEEWQQDQQIPASPTP